jgi:hypothetical protein
MRDEPPAKPDVTEWVDCSWTVYVNEPAEELPIELGVRSDLPQFNVSGLDWGFLWQAYMILRGKTELDGIREHQTGGVAVEGPVRRLAAATPVPHELSIQLHTCSDEFCKLLAVLDEQRTVDIARRWRILLWPSLYQDETDPDPRQELRESVLRQLAHLAQTATAGGRRLMVRIEFRRCTRDPATGRVHKNAGTRH